MGRKAPILRGFGCIFFDESVGLSNTLGMRFVEEHEK